MSDTTCSSCSRSYYEAPSTSCDRKRTHEVQGNPDGNAFREREFVRVKGFRDYLLVVGVPDGRSTGMYTLRGPQHQELSGAWEHQLEAVPPTEILRALNF